MLDTRLKKRELPPQIKEAMEQVKAGKWKMETVPLAITLYARQCFPDIEDRKIREAYQDILFAMEENTLEKVNIGGISGTVVKAPIGLRIDKESGIISAYVKMGEWYHAEKKEEEKGNHRRD